MQNSFQIEVRLMYREMLKIIYRMPKDRRGTLLDKTRHEFKMAAKIPRKEIASIDFAFHLFQRQLNQLQQANIQSMTTYVPKVKDKEI